MLIEYVSPESSGHYVFARRLEDKGFRLTSTSRLGDVSIKPIITQPRAMKKDGTPDLEIFAFQLSSAADLHRFSVGTEVILEE